MEAEVAHAALTEPDVRDELLHSPPLHRAQVFGKEVRGLLLAVLAKQGDAVFQGHRFTHSLALTAHDTLRT
jgi:hypothetical protein